MPRNEVSGPKARAVASRVLADPNASADAKTLAGSVLSQSPDRTPTDAPEPTPAPTPSTSVYAILRVSRETYHDIRERLIQLDKRIGQGPVYQNAYIRTSSTPEHIVFGDVGLEAE